MQCMPFCVHRAHGIFTSAHPSADLRRQDGNDRFFHMRYRRGNGSSSLAGSAPVRIGVVISSAICNVWLQLITGKGAIGQLNLETSVPPFALKAGLLAIVGFNLVTALLPNATFSDENQKDVRKRPAGKAL